jgi:serine/threonine-protein kinase PpkA
VIQIPGYFIKREIGSGGMATVYLAVQTSLEREVALKVMTPALVNDPNFSRRFLMEARTLASLSHANIVAVYDVGVTESQLHYFSMQHLPGGDFAGRLTSGVPEAEVIRVLTGVARALAFAHLRGFVHRDVSPANVLFDASDNPILTDFGIARAVTRTSRLTNAGVSVGTSHYMSPEQARGGSVDARSDLYSLGAVAFEALTGKPPYEGEDGFAIAYAHVFEPVPRLPPHLAHWQELIDRALAKDPNERFADVEALAVALEGLAERGGTSTAPRFPSADTVARAESVPRTESVPLVHDLSLAATTAMPVIPRATPMVTNASSEQVTPIATPAVTDADIAASGAEMAARAPRPMMPALIAIAVGVIGLGLVLFFALRSTDSPATRPGVDATPPVATTPARPADRTPETAPVTGDTAPPSTDTTISPDAGTIGRDEPQVVLGPDGLYPDAGTGEIDTLTGETIGAESAPLSPDEAAALQQAIATTVQDPLNAVLAAGRNDIAQKRLTNPPGRNARERFLLAQKLAERFRDTDALAKAKEGTVATASAYVDLAEASFAENKQAEFLDFLRRSEEIATTLPEGADLMKKIQARRNGLRDGALAEGRAAVAAWQREKALAAYQRALVFDPASAEATRGLKAAERIGQPGFVFRDPLKAGGQGPEMVVVQAGGARVAFARAETTLAEFRASGVARGERPACRDRESFFRSSRKNTFDAPAIAQQGTHPVVCVSFADAERFAQYLSERTGQRYRLPTAAEWRAIAGRVKAADCKANLADSSYNGEFRERDAFSCDDGFAATSPVRSFDADGSGLYDVAGNVREWVSDCAPGCREHAALGSAWASTRDKAGVTQQVSFAADVAANTIGFRVVREVQ